MIKPAIPDIVLTDNTNQRLPCVLVLDGSRSMSYKVEETSAIEELNKGLKEFELVLKNDDIACQRVQILILRFGDEDKVEVLQDWVDAVDFRAPVVNAKGRTPLGKATQLALEKIEDQKNKYKIHDIPYNRPWLFLITDGGPTDKVWQTAAIDCCLAEAAGKLVVFPIGTTNANFEKLSKFSARPPIRLNGLNFMELFIWLSSSVSTTSQEAPGTQVQLPDINWGATSE